MTAEQMILQAEVCSIESCRDWDIGRFVEEREILRDIIRHLCDPENVPYPMTSPEL